jgi:hypothetical protein
MSWPRATSSRTSLRWLRVPSMDSCLPRLTAPRTKSAQPTWDACARSMDSGARGPSARRIRVSWLTLRARMLPLCRRIPWLRVVFRRLRDRVRFSSVGFVGRRRWRGGRLQSGALIMWLRYLSYIMSNAFGPRGHTCPVQVVEARTHTIGPHGTASSGADKRRHKPM